MARACPQPPNSDRKAAVGKRRGAFSRAVARGTEATRRGAGRASQSRRAAEARLGGARGAGGPGLSPALRALRPGRGTRAGAGPESRSPARPCRLGAPAERAAHELPQPRGCCQCTWRPRALGRLGPAGKSAGACGPVLFPRASARSLRAAGTMFPFRLFGASPCAARAPPGTALSSRLSPPGRDRGLARRPRELCPPAAVGGPPLRRERRRPCRAGARRLGASVVPVRSEPWSSV